MVPPRPPKVLTFYIFWLGTKNKTLLGNSHYKLEKPVTIPFSIFIEVERVWSFVVYCNLCQIPAGI